MDSNSTNTSNDMTTDEFRTLKSVGIGVNLFPFLACAIAILLMIFLRAYKTFLMRLVLYLNLTILCLMLAKIAQFIPVKSVNGTPDTDNKDLCTATAFIGQFFASLLYLTEFSMALYLICLTISKNKNVHNRAREICGVITVVTIGIVMATIPLIPIAGDTLYGVFGFNCWIEQRGQSRAGLMEEILLWHLPLTVTVVVMVIALLFAVRVLCVKSQTYQHKQEARTLAVYISILSIFYFGEVTVSIAYILSSGNDLNLRLAGFVIETVLFTLVPAAYIFHPATLKKLRCSEVKQTVNKWRGIHDDEVHTSCHVPPEPEFSEYSDLVITGSNRNRHDSSYRSILERPDAEI